MHLTFFIFICIINDRQQLLGMQEADHDIIKRCREGDRNAFRTIVLQYHRMLFSLALKLLGDEEEAKDAVQDAFVKAWSEMRRYDGSHRFSSWIYIICTRICLNRLRQMQRLVPMPELKAMINPWMKMQFVAKGKVLGCNEFYTSYILFRVRYRFSAFDRGMW